MLKKNDCLWLDVSFNESTTPFEAKFRIWEYNWIIFLNTLPLLSWDLFDLLCQLSYGSQYSLGLITVNLRTLLIHNYLTNLPLTFLLLYNINVSSSSNKLQGIHLSAHLTFFLSNSIITLNNFSTHDLI